MIAGSRYRNFYGLCLFLFAAIEMQLLFPSSCNPPRGHICCFESGGSVFRDVTQLRVQAVNNLASLFERKIYLYLFEL